MLRRRVDAGGNGCRLGILAVLAFGWLSGNVSALMAQQIPGLKEIPPALAAAQPSLVAQRASLIQERAGLRKQVLTLNVECNGIDETATAKIAACTKRKTVLEAAMARHVRSSEAFNKALEQAPLPAAQGCGGDGACTLDAMTAYVARLGWSKDEQARVIRSLDALAVDRDASATQHSIRSAWIDILKRGGNSEVLAAADRGEGPGFPGAGQQTSFQDCAVFALANAAGVPYSVVAARATQLIRDGTWRTAGERANPQRAIETSGLNGGEVVMIAHALGTARIVEISDFPATLKGGNRVLLNVVPSNGDLRSGHEIVLTKTFRYRDQTWFEMMDSNQGPIRRLYLTERELNMIHRENGVAYRSRQDQSPALLR